MHNAEEGPKESPKKQELSLCPRFLLSNLARPIAPGHLQDGLQSSEPDDFPSQGSCYGRGTIGDF
jgi:hypothetical protein